MADLRRVKRIISDFQRIASKCSMWNILRRKIFLDKLFQMNYSRGNFERGKIMPKKSESESDSTIENDGAIFYGYQFSYSGLGHPVLVMFPKIVKQEEQNEPHHTNRKAIRQ